MTLFFFLVALELKRELVLGELKREKARLQRGLSGSTRQGVVTQRRADNGQFFRPEPARLLGGSSQTAAGRRDGHFDRVQLLKRQKGRCAARKTGQPARRFQEFVYATRDS
jgi:hypothetical protein